jgi:hypothetical protein
MLRFSNSKLKQTHYIVKGITPIFGSTGSIVTPISASSKPAHKNVDSSRVTRLKTVCGVSRTLQDTVGTSASDVDLGLMYSNGNRYQYLDYKSNTPECSIFVPNEIVQIQEKTDDGLTYVNRNIGDSIIITAYVGSPVVPQLVPPNNTTCTPPRALKVPVTYLILLMDGGDVFSSGLYILDGGNVSSSGSIIYDGGIPSGSSIRIFEGSGGIIPVAIRSSRDGGNVFSSGQFTFDGGSAVPINLTNNNC